MPINDNFEFRNEYTQPCQKLASEAKVIMRQLDQIDVKYSTTKPNDKAGWMKRKL